MSEILAFISSKFCDICKTGRARSVVWFDVEPVEIGDKTALAVERLEIRPFCVSAVVWLELLSCETVFEEAAALALDQFELSEDAEALDEAKVPESEAEDEAEALALEAAQFE
jgi:hypothetical protein